MAVDPFEDVTHKDAVRPAETWGGASSAADEHATALRLTTPPERIGRYVLEAKLGEGGMGVVYRARDGELDRSVAIKLLHTSRALRDAQVRARFQREAQAMAQLSHPNVVQIYDVGEHDGQIFVAMELIRGRTLREWSRQPGQASAGPRPWRAVLEVLVQAGQGLAAAHDAAIVHRDFKPENVFIADDGRVRVGDFGLARRGADDDAAVEAEATEDGHAAVSGSLTLPGTLIGTPAYMAPEQHLRVATDARTDQFAFCVTLWECLYGERPFGGMTVKELARSVLGDQRREPPRRSAVPKWLRRVVERGLAIDPAGRHASMRALLAELARGHGRARARLAAVVAAALVGAVGAGYAWHRSELAGRVTSCEQAGASVAEIWGDAARERLREGFVATGLGYAAATVDRVIPGLDRHARAWQDARTETCLDARVRMQLDADAADRADWCLDERRVELQSLVDEFMRADKQAVLKAVSAVAGLEDVAACRDARLLARRPMPPADGRAAAMAVRTTLAWADNLRLAGRYEDALTAGREALAQAEGFGWPPLVAAARYSVGYSLDRTGKYVDSEPVLEDAYFEAAAVGSREVEAAAATALINVVGVRLARHAEARRWSRLAELALGSLGLGEDADSAHRLSNLGSVLNQAGDYAAARDAHAAALAIRERVFGPDHPSVAVSLNNLASVLVGTGKYAEARELFERSAAVMETALGPDHPELAGYLTNLANIHYELGDYRTARTVQARAVALREAALGPEHPLVATSLGNLAGLAHTLGDFAAAQAMYERSLAIREKALGPEHPEVASSLLNLANTLRTGVGDPDGARPLLERALAIYERKLGPDHDDVAMTLRGLARERLVAGAPAEARPLLERVRKILEKAVGPEHAHYGEYLQALAEVHLALGERAEGRALLERALPILEKALGPEHAEVGECLLSVARERADAGAYAEARVAAERGMRILEKAYGPEHRDLAFPLELLAEVDLAEGHAAAAVQGARRALGLREAVGEVPRRLAASRFMLARALWEAPADGGGDRARAQELAAQARDALRGVAGQEGPLAAIERWRRDHRGG